MIELVSPDPRPELERGARSILAHVHLGGRLVLANPPGPHWATFSQNRLPWPPPPLFQTSYGLSRDTEPGCWDKLSLRTGPLFPCNSLTLRALARLRLASRLPIKGQATKGVMCVYSKCRQQTLMNIDDKSQITSGRKDRPLNSP